MIDELSPIQCFFNNREKIIDLFINYYGKEYSDIIRNRIYNTHFEFGSTPDENYNFLKEHENQINKLDKLDIIANYIDYMKIEREENRINTIKLFEYIKNNFNVKDIDRFNENNEQLMSLFKSKGFERSYIDAFSTKSDELLNDPNISKKAKEMILQDQEEFNRIVTTIGIGMPFISSYQNHVDELIKYREGLKCNYKVNILKNTEYGKNIFENMNNFFGTDFCKDSFNDSVLKDISKTFFSKDSWLFTLCKNSDNDQIYYNIVILPLYSSINFGKKALDVILIHELIHRVETEDGKTGIYTYSSNDTNVITNEMRTQNIAIKLTKKLHDSGIFIFDNPKDYRIEGECILESLYHLVEDFFNGQEPLITDCAINNTPEKLEEYFGESWKDLGKRLFMIYNKYIDLYLKNRIMPDINQDEEINESIDKMNRHIKERRTKVLKKLTTYMKL